MNNNYLTINNENILGYIPNCRVLKENAIPTLNLPSDSDSSKSTIINGTAENETTKKVNNNLKIIIIF